LKNNYDNNDDDHDDDKYLFVFFKSGFTGYVQQADGNRKSDHGSNHYFDLYLQISEDKNQMIRVMTTGMEATGRTAHNYYQSPCGI